MKKQKKNKLAKRALTQDELSMTSQNVIRDLQMKDDLACVLIGGAFIEECIESVLVRFLIDDGEVVQRLFDPLKNGDLSTYMAKVNVAFCLGFLPEFINKNMKAIGHIRNHFAHSWVGARFTDDQIREDLEKLTTGSDQLDVQLRKDIEDAEVDMVAVYWKALFVICVAQTMTIIQLIGLNVIEAPTAIGDSQTKKPQTRQRCEVPEWRVVHHPLSETAESGE